MQINQKIYYTNNFALDTHPEILLISKKYRFKRFNLNLCLLYDWKKNHFKAKTYFWTIHKKVEISYWKLKGFLFCFHFQFVVLYFIRIKIFILNSFVTFSKAINKIFGKNNLEPNKNFARKKSCILWQKKRIRVLKKDLRSLKTKYVKVFWHSKMMGVPNQVLQTLNLKRRWSKKDSRTFSYLILKRKTRVLIIKKSL